MTANPLRLVLPLALACCGLVAKAGDPAATSAPEAPGFVLYESARGPLLLGAVSEAAVLAAFPDWPLELEGWQPDPGVVAALTTVAIRTDIICVLGTWCDDSRREVPRFWRLLEAAGNPNLRLVMVAVGRADDAAAGRALCDLGFGDDYRGEQGIEKVPTFVFTREGKEVGRIVETPEVSLEADTVAILGKAGREPDPGQDPATGWR